MRRVISFLIILFMGFFPVYAEGTSGAAFLNSPIGARNSGLGNGVSSLSAGAEGIYVNPAMLQYGAPWSVLTTYNPLVEGSFQSQLSVAQKRNKWSWGLGALQVSHNGIPGYDDVGNKTSDFSAADRLFIFGAASKVSVFDYGLNIKGIQSEIGGESASTVGMDAGLFFGNPLSAYPSHSLVIQNLGGKLTFVNQGDPLPLTIRLGTQFSVGKRFLTAIDLVHVRGPGLGAEGGIEWQALQGEVLGLIFRTGYSTQRSDAGNLSGFSLGTGFEIKDFRIDYAWLPLGELGNSHSLSLVWMPQKVVERQKVEKKPRKRYKKPRADLEPTPRKWVLLTLDTGKKVRGELIRETQKRYQLYIDGRRENILKRDVLHIKFVPAESKE